MYAIVSPVVRITSPMGSVIFTFDCLLQHEVVIPTWTTDCVREQPVVYGTDSAL